MTDVWNAIDLSPSASITLSPRSCTKLDVVGLLFHKMKSKRARSIHGTLSVCGCVINLMPLEPVPVWTPLDCCLILIQKQNQISRKNKRPRPGNFVFYITTQHTHVPPSQTERQDQTRKGSGGEATAAAARASSACRRNPGVMVLPL